MPAVSSNIVAQTTPRPQADTSTSLPSEAVSLSTPFEAAVAPAAPSVVESPKPQSEPAYTAPTLLSADDFLTFPGLGQSSTGESSKPANNPNGPIAMLDIPGPYSLMEKRIENERSKIVTERSPVTEAVLGEIHKNRMRASAEHRKDIMDMILAK